MSNLHLYPSVPVRGYSSKGRKIRTVPNQSLSLAEIIKRFVRRESLPLSKEGVYEERFGDIEKLSKADVTEQMDKVEEIKSRIDGFNKRQKERADKEAQDKADAAAQASKPVEPPAVGGAPVKVPGTPSPS